MSGSLKLRFMLAQYRNNLFFVHMRKFARFQSTIIELLHFRPLSVS